MRSVSGTELKIGRTEGIFLFLGLILLGMWVSARLYGTIRSRMAVAQFRALEAADQPANEDTSPSIELLPNSPADFRMWSAQRISAYKDTLSKEFASPIALLRIPKLALEVPVFNGTDDLTLNRGVGRILGTAKIGQPGNLGIAGHRDSFFRGLQKIAAGDVVELARASATDTYTVHDIKIVMPEDTHVLDSTPTSTLTLVTCFPFYFVGQAPKRFIVAASLESTRSPSLSPKEDPNSSGKNAKTNKEK
jgi:sortase A